MEQRLANLLLWCVAVGIVGLMAVLGVGMAMDVATSSVAPAATQFDAAAGLDPADPVNRPNRGDAQSCLIAEELRKMNPKSVWLPENGHHIRGEWTDCPK